MAVRCFSATGVKVLTNAGACAADRTGLTADAASLGCWKVGATSSTCAIWAPGWAKGFDTAYYMGALDTVVAVDPAVSNTTTNASMIATSFLIAFVAFMGLN